MNDGSYIDLIIVELTDGMTQCSQSVKDNINFWWSVTGSDRIACGNSYYHYLLAKLEGVKSLIACYSYEVDMIDSSGANNRSSESTSRGDGYTQSQNTAARASKSDAIGQSRYSELTNGASDAENVRNASGWSNDDQYRSYTDKGEGATTTTTSNGARGYTFDKDGSENITRGVTSGKGAKTGCEYTLSSKEQAGFGFAGGGDVLGMLKTSMSGGQTASASNWDHYMKRQDFMNEISVSKTRGSVKGAASGRQKSFRNMDSTMFFDALVDSINRGASNARNDDETHGFKDDRSHGEGYGQSVANSNSDGTGGAQGTSEMHDESDASSKSSGLSYSRSDTVKSSQKAKNMLRLHDQLVKEIEMTRRMFLSNQAPVLRPLPNTPPRGFRSPCRTCGMIGMCNCNRAAMRPSMQQQCRTCNG